MEVELASEARIHELESRIEELEALRSSDRAEIDALRQSEQSAHAQLDETKASNEHLKQQNTEVQQSNKDVKQGREKTDAEKRDLLDALARSDGDKQALEAQITELRSSSAATQASLRSLEAAYSGATENERSYKLRLQALEGELSIVQKDRDWNHAELQRVSEESGRDRREKNAQISRLQTQLDSATQSSESALSSLSTLRTSRASLEGRLTEALTKVSSLSSELAESEASFRSEIATSQRLTDLLEKREEDTKKRLEEVEREWDAAKEDMDSAKQVFEEELLRERQRGDALESRVQEMRDFADSLAANGAPLSSIPGGLDEDVFGTPRSPSASTLAIKLQKSGGKSYTEIYTSYIKMQEALTLERAESKRLSECLNEILGEIQDRAPLLREQRAEYERAIGESNELSAALAIALDDKDNVSRTADESRLQIEQKTRELAITAQQLEDTSRQVRTLARRVAILEDPSIVDRSDSGEDPILQNADDTADSYITTTLVTFQSIDQLQQQNQKLLKITRELAKKMEAEEQALRDRLGRAENEAVEEAHDLILRLKDEVESQRATMGAYQRERDMLRQLLRNRSNVSMTEDGEVEESSGRIQSSSVVQSALDDVQRNFDAYKREMVIDNQSLQQDLTKARHDASQLQIDLARSNAQRELLEERFKMISDTNSRQGKEIKDTSKRNMELQTSMARQDEATRRVTEEVLDLKGNLDRVKHEAMMLKAEKEVWKNVEARLTEDNANLAKDRSHLSDLMRNLQSMHNELEKNGSDARRRLEEQISRLQRDLDSAKERASQEADSARQVSMRRELESKDYQERIDKLTSEYHEAREALITAKNASSRSEERAEGLARQIAAYEEKLAVYEGRRGQSVGDGSVSREQQLESQVADLRGELSRAKKEVEQANSHVEQYKAIAQVNEETLADLNTTYDEYKRNMESTVTQKDGELATLQERIAVFTTDLTAASNENSDLHRQLEAQRASFQQEQQANLDTISNLRAIEGEVSSMRSAAKKDFDDQVRRYTEAHDKYQSELVAHAEDVKILNGVRAQLGDLQSALNQATSQAETAQANLGTSESSWARQKEDLQKELDEQQKRCNDLISQNSILHNHLETVSTQAARIQQTADGQAPEEGEDVAMPTTEAKSADELHAVIRYVRREKDVAELRLELSRQQESRLRQQLEHANKQLDEKSSELSQERQKSAESMSAASQHGELLEKIQSLNLLRESNETLRRETQRHLERASSLEQRLTEAESQLSPLRDQVRVFAAEMEARDRNIKMLEEDNARWKNRTQQILQKYERIDPAELAQLKEELEKVKATLEEAQKERDAAQSKMAAVSTDLNDANTRAEANQARFKSLQQLARKHRDDHKDAMSQSEAQRTTLQAEIDQLTSAKAELEEKLNNQQTSSASASEEATGKLQAEKEEITQKLEAEKQELAAARDAADRAKEELETTRKRIEDELSNQTKRNIALLSDNKKFRSRIQELEKTATETLEAEIEKRLAAMPSPTIDTSGIPAGDEEAIRARLAELEERLAKERDSSIQSAISETVTRLQKEFEEERAKFSSQAASTGEPGSADEADIQKRIEDAAAGKVEAAVRAKEEEMAAAKEKELQNAVKAKEDEVNKAIGAKIQEAKKQVEQAAQQRAANLSKEHQQALEKLQKEHNDRLDKAVADTKAEAASSAPAGATSNGASKEDVDKAVKEALEQKEAEHSKALATKTAEVEKKAKQEYDLKSKLRESQIVALRKESQSLKAKLSQATSNGDASTSAGSPATPSTSAFPSVNKAGSASSPTGTPAPAATASPKGLSIAGRSQSQQGIATRSGASASPGPAGLNIAGTAAAAAADGSPGRGRGRGRGAPRGGGPAGRGRGGLVNAALSAATETGAAKRAREDEGADSEAKRRKDGADASQ